MFLAKIGLILDITNSIDYKSVVYIINANSNNTCKKYSSQQNSKFRFIIVFGKQWFIELKLNTIYSLNDLLNNNKTHSKPTIQQSNILG